MIIIDHLPGPIFLKFNLRFLSAQEELRFRGGKLLAGVYLYLDKTAQPLLERIQFVQPLQQLPSIARHADR